MKTYVYKLKFGNKAVFKAWLDAEINNTSIMTIVPIGQITTPATYDIDGVELTPAVTLDGYHVDIMTSELIESLNPYVIDTPEHPQHGLVWADGSELVRSLPTLDWLKADIQAWLTAHGIDFNTSDTKQQLIDRVQ